MKKNDNGRVLFATIKNGLTLDLLQIKLSANKYAEIPKTGKPYIYYGNWYLETYVNGVIKTRKHINKKIAVKICDVNNLTEQFNIIFKY